MKENISLFIRPKDEDMRQKWIRAVECLSDTTRVYAEHFHEKDFTVISTELLSSTNPAEEAFQAWSNS